MADTKTPVAKIVVARAVAEFSDLVKAAIEAGHIKVETKTVEISDKASPTTKGVAADYQRLYAQNAQGMAAICNGKIVPATDKPAEGKDERTDEEKAAGACDYFNYGHDLEVKAEIRQELMDTLVGPEKGIKKAYDGAVLMGYSKTEAADLVRNSPKFKGVEGLEELLKRAQAA